MAFRIELSARAMRDIADIYHYIAIDSDAPINAIKWRHDLEQHLLQLVLLARGLPLAEENEASPCEVRQLLFGKYRILFTVEMDVAFVLTVRHGHRLPISGAELTRIWKQRPR